MVVAGDRHDFPMPEFASPVVPAGRLNGMTQPDIVVCRAAVKAQYLAEGTKLSSALHADGWHDMHLHARLNNDFDDHAARFS